MLEDFNVPLVLGFYGFAIVVAGLLTYYRWSKKRKEL